MELSQYTPRFAIGWQTHCAHGGEAAITFDDGPDPKTTPSLLKTLEALHLRATMFVVGQKCRGNATLLREIASAGHKIACHGYAHERHWFKKSSFVESSIRQSLYLLQDYGIQMEPIFRPPFGAIDFRMHRVVTGLKCTPMLWSAHVADWKPQSPLELRQRMESAVNDRMILLLHDGHETTANVRDQLPYLRDEIERNRLRSVVLMASQQNPVSA